MIKLRHLLISAVLSMALTPVWANDDQIFNQVDLQTSASQQVDNDQLVAVLLVQETGNNPATLANKVNMKMAQIIDKTNKYKAIEHQTINYNSRPIYKNGTIKSWQVSQNIKLQSKDFDQLDKLVGKVNTLSTLQSMNFTVSDESVEQMQQILTDRAIQKFKNKASRIAQQFDKKGYHLVRVNIGNNYVRPPQRHMMRSAMAAESMDVAPALSAGTNKISVNISGTIELF